MCTVLVLNRVHRDAPLILAANRDEFYSRPTSGPQLLQTEPRRILGGHDLEHGGTWMGLNQDGLAVVLTNMRSTATDKRSRGEIVLRALSCRSLAEVDSLLRSDANDGEYRPFNLLYGTADGLRVAYHREHELTIEPVPAGVHVLPSGGRLDDARLPKVSRAMDLVGAGSPLTDLDVTIDALFGVLADHNTPLFEALPQSLRRSGLSDEIVAKLQALCVHTPDYGTRSSSIAVLGNNELRYYYSDGPACEGRLERVDGLL